MVNLNRCCVCKCEKPIDQFSLRKSHAKDKSVPPRPRGECRECVSSYNRTWKIRRKESGLPTRNREKEKAAQNARYHNDKAYREDVLEKNRIRRRQEPAKITQRANERQRQKDNPQYRIGKALRSRVRVAIKGIAKSAPTLKLLGCSIEHLMAHLEARFQPGMTWENHTLKGWHIDHIIPCVAFDLTKPEEQAKCFHWSNLQPLWAFDNISKHDWVPDYQI